MNMHARAFGKKAKVILEPLEVLAAANARTDLRIEALNPHLELNGPRREARDLFPQRLGETVGNHFKVQEHSRLIALEEKLENGSARLRVQIESPVDKLELPRAALEQPLHFFQKQLQVCLPHRNIER